MLGEVRQARVKRGKLKAERGVQESVLFDCYGEEPVHSPQRARHRGKEKALLGMDHPGGRHGERLKRLMKEEGGG